MNKKVLNTLEFNKIIDRLTALAGSDRGREYCNKLHPVSDIDKIKERQEETSAALGRILRDGSVSFSGTFDPGFYLKRLSIGSSLTMSELLKIASLLTVAKRVKRYGSSGRLETEDVLAGYFNELEPLSPISDEITRCILSEEEMADDASPGLKNARRQIGILNERIRSQMNSMLNSASVRDCLQDTVITMRGGRYCLPVRAEFKSQVPGMVHDQSGSGATLFIEPSSVVELNNKLREAELEEKAEIEKVLAELSIKVSEVSDEVRNDFRILSSLDFIFAKGMLAKEQNAMFPELNTEGRIYLRKARHPLLDPKKVVPIDVYLGDEFDQLIITGPNTGGKTVSLKTVGLLTLMAQSGLHIPAGDRSVIAVFNDVYADIGDEQSIEQSLSTFSSHMTNIVYILGQVESPQKAERSALVLFDELCAGTDPSEGAALATAILARLHRDGIRTMATTHYSELKVYALTTDGVENGSCEFSLETLSPTYRLLIGVPGKSNAFAISGKLGLKLDLIEDARNRVEDTVQSLEDLFTDLEENRIAMEHDRD
ncbi:MAG: endonuclease MutS2, partial [Lachnospiraceae bacterium]|nr:endonuclease MutS2 [Lachnospiraceae bacterium]